MRITVTLYLQVLLWLCFSNPVPGQAISKPPSVFERLTGDENAKIQLELNLDALLNNRRNAEYLQATLSTPDGQAYKLEVRTRGKFRRRKCEIPPIKFKFLKEELQTQQLDTFNEIKLVLPCSAEPASEDLLIREYLAYRMFESLTPISARARLVRLELKNSKKKRPQKMLAMLVEHEEEIAARFQAVPVQEWGLKADRFQTEQVALMILFQYMIGNTDWDLEACRNVLALKPHDSDKMLAIPFDFDFSGLVSAPYASPNSQAGIKTVQERSLMPFGVDAAALRKAKETIMSAKPSLMRWCEHSLLSEDAVNHANWFLDMFFNKMAASAEIPAIMEAEKK